MISVPVWLPRSPLHLIAHERKGDLLVYLQSTCTRVVQCDFTHCDSKQQVLVAIGSSLGFPASFQGRSLDAFFDLLWDSVAADEAFAIVMEGFTAFAQSHPETAQDLQAALAEVSEGSELPRVYWVA